MALRATVPIIGPSIRPEVERPAIADDVERGLTSTPKSLPPRLFYDARGSELFEQITRLPEYYLTRTERSIFETYADEMIAAAGTGLAVIELGAGTAEKTEILLRAALQRQFSLTYYPVDVSSAALYIAEERLAQALPHLRVVPVIADYTQGLTELRKIAGRKLVLSIGSSIGNFDLHEAAAILMRIADGLADGDALLLGTDLVKRTSLLHAAYNDAAGVTAAFNLNLLERINRELGADFDLRRFRHDAVWNPAASRIEMYLVSLRDQRVRIPAIGQTIHFREGERIHTENSYKFTREMVQQLLGDAGFDLQCSWCDRDNLFAVHLACRSTTLGVLPSTKTEIL
jgi:dimethylhistidine N-methyltransferase